MTDQDTHDDAEPDDDEAAAQQLVELLVGQKGGEVGVRPEIDAPEVRLGRPRVGWLPIRLALGSFELDVRASHVLNDPLEELLDAALFALDGRSGIRRISLWLEPAGYALDIWPCTPEYMQLSVSHDENYAPPMAGQPLMPVFTCLVSRRPLAQEVLSQASALVDACGEQLPTEWLNSTELYARRLAALEAAIVDGQR